jgi:hypothetical protein
VLRCRGIDSETPERSLFRILDGKEPAGDESVARVARLADVLLRENGLAGSFRPHGQGLLALELPESQRTFFHNGIVFAALDAYNDPVKNPTLTLSAQEGTD